MDEGRELRTRGGGAADATLHPPSSTFDLRAAACAAMLESGFHPDFPPTVERELERLPDEPPLSDDVVDMRALPWSSIDNRESRDLDQVEFAERVGDGTIRLRIGVADVDALVPKGCATDEHAAENTTSVYTGVAVFPMLPERLSTDLTSLNEAEDRLAVVVEMDVRPDGAVERRSVYRALVHNHAKLIYERVAAWLDGTIPEMRELSRAPGLADQLRLQDEAATRLRTFRERGGTLDLESTEPQLVVARGRVVDMQQSPRNRARDMIESFMVAANTAMAGYLDERRVPSLRRVVRTPRRWERLVSLAADIGETLPPEPDRAALGAFLARRKEADPEHFADLSLAVVKLLGPGEYIVERRMDVSRRDGHFGLGVADYTHSTAPNRRFADLVTQRLFKGASRTPGAEYRAYTEDELAAIARHCTEREDAARRVARVVRKKAVAAFMADRIGERFTSVVTGASSKGTYVRLLSPAVEGRVVRNERALDVGDTVKVTLLAVDPEKGYIDFEAPPAPDLARKLERTRRKRAAAERLRERIGETFHAEVTGASPRGTYARLLDAPGEGRIVRGTSGLTVGQRVRVRLLAADPVHGFIDFERVDGVEPRKQARTRRKQRWARELADRIGERFDAVITGVTPKATWLRLDPSGIEGRLVRGLRGVAVGDRVAVVLLSTDPDRGYIDFAREE
jgi:exoribonuclease-2